jgi:hypothetical protein
MIAPALFRRYFRPMYEDICRRIREAGKHVHFHSDGCITEIIPDFCDIGVQVLNVEHAIIGERALGVLARGRVCFRTYVDSQFALAFGSPEQVKEHVLEVVRHLSTRDGGLIAYGECNPQVPLANYRAMHEAFEAGWPAEAGATTPGAGEPARDVKL